MPFTPSVEAFLKKTTIAYHPNSRKSAKFWLHAIAVFFKMLRHWEYFPLLVACSLKEEQYYQISNKKRFRY